MQQITPYISRIRPYVTTEAYETLVQGLVISRMDYGNALLYGISLAQRIQNCAARERERESEYITRVLLELRWSPVK